MQPPVAQVVGRQELPGGLCGWEFDHVLRVGQEGAIHGQGHGHLHPLVLGDSVSDQHMLQGLLGGGDPTQEPAQVPDGQGIVVFYAKGTGIVQRPVAHQEQHRQPVGCRHRQGLKAVQPARAAAPGKGSRPHGTGVLDNLELAVLAVGDDILSL